jgi:RND family efflux transporter MFP subunit
LFVLAATDPIRSYVSVPEVYAGAVHTGLAAYLELTQFPGEKFQAKVTRTADAIDLASRTLNTEVDVPNKKGMLLPGGYAQVHLLVGVTGTRLQVPVNALLFRSEGLRAVVVDADHKIHLQQLAIGRDYGTALEVLQGLKPDDWIVLNPPDSLDEGMQVNIKEQPQPAPRTNNGPPPPPGNSGPQTPGKTASDSKAQQGDRK